MKISLLLLSLISSLLFGCASRSLERDYRVIDASHEDIPQWVSELDEWLDDEEDDYKKNKYYIYTSEAKNSRDISCELAKAKSASIVAGEISTSIKHSFAQSIHGDASSKTEKLNEYIEDNLAKVVQAHIVGAKVYKTYWEKRKFEKELGAKQDWNGFVCTALIKMSKGNLKKAFARTEKTLAAKVDQKAKVYVQKIMKEASEAYNK